MLQVQAVSLQSNEGAGEVDATQSETDGSNGSQHSLSLQGSVEVHHGVVLTEFQHQLHGDWEGSSGLEATCRLETLLPAPNYEDNVAKDPIQVGQGVEQEGEHQGVLPA